MKRDIKKTINVPENVKVTIAMPKIIVEGPVGKVEKTFKVKGIEIKLDNDKVIIKKEKATKKEKKIINTIVSKIESMICGVKKEFEYQLQICSTHFPISVDIEKQNNLLIIKNFLGENKDRVVKVFPGIDISINGDIITIKSPDKELAGQQAANIEIATKISARDRRIFQDGIWIIRKEKGRKREE
ncbi:MAG: 50S ribosomal protein L6 [Candidatus Pacearchaeota archaeon]|nr:50S ribosomal protein L6 [Candidatus Pacearchaeota archaeon]